MRRIAPSHVTAGAEETRFELAGMRLTNAGVLIGLSGRKRDVKRAHRY